VCIEPLIPSLEAVLDVAHFRQFPNLIFSQQNSIANCVFEVDVVHYSQSSMIAISLDFMFDDTALSYQRKSTLNGYCIFSAKNSIAGSFLQ
jgi:hypothetical protein